MKLTSDWFNLTQTATPIVAVEYASADFALLLKAFADIAQQQSCPLYYWSPGVSTLQQVSCKKGQLSLDKMGQMVSGETVLSELLEQQRPGIYLLDNLLESSSSSSVLTAQLKTAFYQLQWLGAKQYWVILDEFITLDSPLQPLIPLLKYPLPNEQEVKAIVTRTLDKLPHSNSPDNSEQTIATLTRACQGLPQGEIELLLKRYLNCADSPAALSTRILQHKVSKFSGEGIEYIANPDVSEAAGLDNLSVHAANLIKLMDSDALKYNLRPPKGLLLLGVPGTGKTLSAKLIAQSLNVPLLGVSWGNILAADSPDRALSKLLEIAENLHAVILWDDFDKGFTDWESSEGGVSRRLSQKILTWMQEHESKVYVIATINRLELVKTEILRRFEDIFFIDLPHLGAMFEIFRLHLAKHFPAQFGEGGNPWDDRIWYRVLKAYKGATPAEIGNAVKRCKERFYCGLSAEEREWGGIVARVTVEELLYQRTQFIPISISRSEDIQGIRNQAVNIQKAGSEDSSRFAGSTQQLFEYQPHGLE